MCNCKGKCSCSSVITTGRGPTGATGPQGPSGTNGTNGVLDWSDYDLSCWVTNGITESEATNDEITQDLIDEVCSLHEFVNAGPVAVNDYVTMNQDTTIYVQVTSNDKYFLDVTVTITTPPSNGTATVQPDGKTIKYIPNTGFTGIEDFGYTITDTNLDTASAVVIVDVQEVISQQTIEDTVLEQLTILLQSNDYWDLGFNIGDKIGISNINLVDFDFTNAFTAGKGKNTARYKKWAICNGNNGTEDLTEGTFRGFDHTNTDYDESAKTGGSDSVTLSIDNIPPHKHQYFDSFINAIDGGSEIFSEDVDAHATATGVTQGAIYNSTIQVSEGPSDNRDAVWYDRNTMDGTDNQGNQLELKATPDAVDIRNSFKTVILIQKIA